MANSFLYRFAELGKQGTQKPVVKKCGWFLGEKPDAKRLVAYLGDDYQIVQGGEMTIADAPTDKKDGEKSVIIYRMLDGEAPAGPVQMVYYHELVKGQSYSSLSNLFPKGLVQDKDVKANCERFDFSIGEIIDVPAFTLPQSEREAAKKIRAEKKEKPVKTTAAKKSRRRVPQEV